MKQISLTPAVFHLSDQVNQIAPQYSINPIVPRGPKLQPIMDRVRQKLVETLNVVKTHEAVIFTASGSGAIAAVVGSCISEQGILVISNGAYGERQARYCEQLGLKTVRYTLEYGERPDLIKIKELIEEYKIGTIGMVYGCTSTCSINPVAEVGKIAQQYGLRFIVDAVAAVFVEQLNIQDWHIDALIGSTNKGLHSNPDLSFALISKDYLNEIKNIPARIPYLDILETITAQRKGSHSYTINIRALLELDAALDNFIIRGGLESRIAMYQARTSLLRDGYEKLGLKIFQKPGMPFQNIGTALYIPENISYQKLADYLSSSTPESYNIYSAQGKLSDTVFRIFNMGEYDIEVYHRFLISLEKGLNQ